MDIIFLREVRADTVIGVYDWERKAAQTIEIDLEIGIPSDTPCHSDDIGDTIHYGVVVERLRQSLEEQHFLLLEALAEHIAQMVREEFGAPWVRVAVTKLGILPGVKRVGVQIERGHRPN
ncbi:dihydroneopterin aldolase [Chromobacterium violaceum]|uniref:Dihydroneopterin aldolase n=2 Tax=Chromobacterium violaceum TaxID=536 RepID=A0A1R0MWH3_CHRVL|nr:dihydroneopterin aldolase [Chromobacterium violaceum]AAQ61351.1 dihydroneopterin aldolase [Chromobacterium violaceum ATCC 12472]ATP29964.1 dienelactone hydrolase [Chromobacterium violaceum]ATP33870.1 dienelactone hydrolase [Chromobacterium violaceum]KJH68444.1 dienelactone hydrolase [Chromobacterium violaceum]KMN47566.1 dienelactone hydrolase [Chromobacterium violaceum]